MQPWTHHAHQARERKDPSHSLDADLRREPGITMSNGIGRREIMDATACGRDFLPAQRQRRFSLRGVFDLCTHLRRTILAPRTRAKFEHILRDPSAIHPQLNTRLLLVKPDQTELDEFTHVEELPEI